MLKAEDIVIDNVDYRIVLSTSPLFFFSQAIEAGTIAFDAYNDGSGGVQVQNNFGCCALVDPQRSKDFFEGTLVASEVPNYGLRWSRGRREAHDQGWDGMSDRLRN